MQQIIRYRGVDLNRRTINMIEAAEKLTGLTFLIAQGSYRAGKTAASAGTHDGGGAVDVDAKNMTDGRRRTIRDALRQVGFAAWIRNPDQGDWNWHVHAVAVGDADLSASAARQVAGYLSGGRTGDGHNGLANNGPDDGPRTWVGVTWEAYLKAHPNTEELSMADISDLIEEIKRQGDATRALIKAESAAGRQETRRQQIWALRYGVQIADNLETAADRYDATMKAGGTVEQAEAAYQGSMSDVAADLAKRATDNG